MAKKHTQFFFYDISAPITTYQTFYNLLQGRAHDVGAEKCDISFYSNRNGVCLNELDCSNIGYCKCEQSSPSPPPAACRAKIDAMPDPVVDPEDLEKTTSTTKSIARTLTDVDGIQTTLVQSQQTSIVDDIQTTRDVDDIQTTASIKDNLNDDSSDGNQTLTFVLAILLSVAFLLVIGIGFAVWFTKKSKKSSSSTTSSNSSMEMNTEPICKNYIFILKKSL